MESNVKYEREKWRASGILECLYIRYAIWKSMESYNFIYEILSTAFENKTKGPVYCIDTHSILETYVT